MQEYEVETSSISSTTDMRRAEVDFNNNLERD